MRGEESKQLIHITPDVSIDEEEIKVTFVRASGPGGQKVNKVATAAELRFDVGRSPSLPPRVKDRLIRLGGKRISEDGVLIIDARRFRTQRRNRTDAVDRLIALIRRAAVKPKPRRKTTPTAASRQRRLAEKRRRSLIKQKRRKVPNSEE
jgi:ribosome-associated protein